VVERVAFFRFICGAQLVDGEGQERENENQSSL